MERHNSFSFDNRLIGKNYQTIVRRDVPSLSKVDVPESGRERKPGVGGR